MLISTLLALTLAAQTAAAPAVQTAPTPAPLPTPDGPVIAIETSMGTIQVGLFASKAPLSTKNIMAYVKSGFYAGTIFHRVIPGFMVQGGGLDAKLVEKSTNPPVRNEAKNGLLNRRGSLSLARTPDPQSATSQFFINVKDNAALDFGISRDGWGYAVFGQVISGMEVVDAIVNVPTTRSGAFDNVPVKPVVITRVRVISEPSAPPAPTRAIAPGARPAASRPATAAPKAPVKASPAETAKPKPSTTPMTH